ncbi:MAG TPA: DUF1840 domain-containing protein [Burkholderiaceae bacterium]|nr:DUF1840 domain-containing protein [Burkholderiaceae bacterium]
MIEQRVATRYEFKSKATGRLILLGPSGEQLLRVIGKDPSAPGIIAPATMPMAIAAIATAIEREEVQAQRHSANGALVTDGHDASRGDGVTLRQRAWPFVEMMKQAHHEGEAIVWGV